MKRLSSDDSLNGLMSICPNSTVDVDENSHGNNPMYAREFQTMLEEMDEEEPGHISEKKRRLSVKQVKALEKNFEVENKLEPERKVKLAEELGLEPRQVAVWFQNRRARWKTKQLERDYGLLKASHDALKNRYESLQRENEDLLNEIRVMKLKMINGSVIGKVSVKEEATISDTTEKRDLKIHDGGAAAELSLENSDAKEDEMIGGGAAFFRDFKDGSDSDSSAILNEGNNSPIAVGISSSGGILRHSPRRFLDVHGGWLTDSAMNTNFAATASVFGDANKVYENASQFVKIEEHNFFGEESCINLFTDDQAPNLHWYCNDEWN